MESKTEYIHTLPNEKESRIPSIRFNGFTKKWVKVNLGRALKVNSGKDYKHLNPGTIPVYGTGGYMLSVNKSLSEKDAIGIGRKGTIDKPQFLKAPFWTVDTLFYMTAKENNDLLFHFSLANRINWKKIDESTGVPSLSKVNIDNLNVYIPSEEEQTKIGSFFRLMDETISLKQQELATLKQIKQGFMQKLFPKEEETVPEVRISGFNGEWKQCKLGRLGKTFTGLSGKTKEDFGHGTAEFVTYMNVFSNPVSDTKMTENVEVDSKQNELKYGDVLFTTSSETPHEVGMSSVWLDNRENVYLNSFCFGFRPTVNVNPLYIAYLLRSNSIRKQMMLLAQGISRYNISKTKVMEISVKLPCIEEQTKIGEFFNTLDKTIELHEKELEVLKETKKAFLQKMFV